MTSRRAAVVTSFRPDDALIAAIEALKDQVDVVAVVDDGSGAAFASVLAGVQARGAQVIHLETNTGIGAALNAGIRSVLRDGANLVVTLDQDSVIPAGFVDALESAAISARAAGRADAPVVPEFFAEVRQAGKRAPDGTLLAHGVIQSGMLLSRELLDEVGLMREDLFIDLVDTEFELRCLAAGRPVVAASGLALAHKLGARYVRGGIAVPGIPVVMTLSAPFRYYYRARNRVIIGRAYRRLFPIRILRDAIVDRVYFAVVASLGRPRADIRRVLRAGRRAGRRGESGRMPDELRELALGISWNANRID